MIDFPNDPPQLAKIHGLVPFIESQRRRTRAATGTDASAIILPAELDPGIYTLSESGDALNAGVVVNGLPVVFGAPGQKVALVYDVLVPASVLKNSGENS